MRVLVTGAGRAIGRATCEQLAARGHEVVASARDPRVLDGLDAAARIELDVTDPGSVARAIASAGALDAIVNNAAVTTSGPLEFQDLDVLARLFETNVAGALRMTQAVAAEWRERGSGIIVNVSSIQGRVATPLEGAYSASKYALEAISETLHYELGHFGIRVAIVEPGFTAPGMRHVDDPETPEPYIELAEQWSGTDTKVTGGGRPAPETVAKVIVDVIEDPDAPLRTRCGPDADLVLEARSSLDDATFEAAMREVLGFTW